MPNQQNIQAKPAGIVVPLDLAGYQILDQDQDSTGRLRITIRANEKTATCPFCQQKSQRVHDTRTRKKRDIALRGYRVILELQKRRFLCASCQRSFTEPDTICGTRRRTTTRLRIFLGEQGLCQPIFQVATATQFGQRFVSECVSERVASQLEAQGRSLSETEPLAAPKFLGIDEFATRKGHRYETILCDLEHRTILEVSSGRTKEEVIPLLLRLHCPESVEAVSMDMSASFRPAVQAALPQAQIVVDHFHVIQHFGKGFRKVVSSWAHKKEGTILLHHKQGLFLRPKETLTQEQTQEREQIATCLPVLHAAWQAKEALRSWYATATVDTAPSLLDAWIAQVQSLQIPALTKTLSAFVSWRDEMLAFFRFLPDLITNGFVEGKNNRTKALIRRAYGYRNRLHLRLRILSGDVA